MLQLPLNEYVSHIHLHDEFLPSAAIPTTTEQLVNDLLEMLIQEPGSPKDIHFPNDITGKRKLLRGLLNIRQPRPLNETFLTKMDVLIQTELQQKGVVEVGKLEKVANVFPDNSFSQSDKMALWQGDITQINADAIVNAANSQMLGCFQPLHACIDNAIHSAAGPQLRNDCDIIMSIQGELEQTGNAKITRAYNLPSKFVLHTVGPIVPKETELTEQQMDELALCYRSCLDLAHEIEDIKTIAFCAISTGVFGFPKPEAAHIAVNTVNEWLSTHPHHFETIIFNVFSQNDFDEYRKVFT